MTSDAQIADAFRRIYGYMIDDTSSAPTWAELAVARAQAGGSQKIRRLVPALAGAIVILVAIALVIVPALRQPSTAATASQQYLDVVLGNAATVHQDPTIYQPEIGPAPAFDASTLGTEVPLRTASGTDGGLDAALQLLPSSQDHDPASARGPILHIGSLDDGARLLLLGFSDRGYVWAITSAGGAEGAGTFDRYGAIGSLSDAGGTHGAVRVPLETSVVVFELNDGTALWQRPVAGYGLFPFMRYGEPPSGTITALDATGATIGHWLTTPTLDTTIVTSDIEDSALGPVMATWVNMLGLNQQDPDIWRSRLYEACTLGVWDKSVAVDLATRYIDEDASTSVRSEAMGPPSVENAANALWLMATQVCRDNFPDEAIAAGPLFPASG